MAFFDGDPDLLFTLDLSSLANVQAVGGSVSGAGGSFSANGFTPGLTSHIVIPEGSGIDLPAGFKDAGTISIEYESSGMATDQLDRFDPATASPGNQMTEADLIQSTGNRDLVSSTFALLARTTGTGDDNQIGIRKITAARCDFLTKTDADVADFSAQSGVNNLGSTTKTMFVTWEWDGANLTTVWHIDRLQLQTTTKANPFTFNWTEFLIAGGSGLGMGGFFFKTVQWVNRFYFNTPLRRLSMVGDSYFQQNYPNISSGDEFGSFPRLDTQWGAMIEKLTNADVTLFNDTIGGYAWSESAGLSLIDRVSDMVGTNRVLCGASVNDVLGGSVPSDLESSINNTLDAIIARGVESMFMINTPPFSVVTVFDTQPVRDAITAQNVIFAKVASERPEVTFFDIFNALGGFGANRNCFIGSAMEDLGVASGSGEITSLHLAPMGTVATGEKLTPPIEAWLNMSNPDFFIGQFEGDVPPGNRETSANIFNTRADSIPTPLFHTAGSDESIIRLGCLGKSNSTSTAQNFDVGLYTVTAGDLDVLLGQVTLVFPGTDSSPTGTNVLALDAALSSVVPLVEGMVYGIAGISETAGNLQVTNDASVSGTYQRDSTVTSGELPDPFSVDSTSAAGYVMWGEGEFARGKPVLETSYPNLTNDVGDVVDVDLAPNWRNHEVLHYEIFQRPDATDAVVGLPGQARITGELTEKTVSKVQVKATDRALGLSTLSNIFDWTINRLAVLPSVANQLAGLGGPAVGVVPVTAFDVPIPGIARLLYARVTGDVAIVGLDGVEFIYTVVTVGIQDIAFVQINTTGTTGTTADYDGLL